MSAHSLSPDDHCFMRDFESGALAPDRFDHRAHVRLAYVHLVELDTEAALARIRRTLTGFLAHHGIDAAKYHETMTRAWLLAVRHFMACSPAAPSAEAFIDANPALLESRIMMTHYSPARLFSSEARQHFVEPDLSPIPRYAMPNPRLSGAAEP